MKDLCIKYGQQWVKNNNKKMSQYDWKVSNGAPTNINHLKRLFGTWTEFLKQANMPLNVNNNFCPKKCIEYVKTNYPNGLTQQEYMKDLYRPSDVLLITNYFGNWNNFLSRCNLDIKIYNYDNLTNQEFKNLLKLKISTNKITNCWNFKGQIVQGYGKLTYKNKKYFAHRLYYEIFKNKKIPENMVLRHLCDNKKCCNPDHLEIGTKQENAIDKLSITKTGNKLKEKDVLYIRNNFNNTKENYEVLMKKFNISRTTVYDIIQRKTWKHI